MAHLDYTPIYAGSKVVGKVKNGTFYKSIRKNHYLRQPPAIAFDLDTLDQAAAAGADKVQVTDRDTGQVYRSTIHHIREKGKQFNRGYGDQVYLMLEGWTVIKPGGGLQLPMFGGVA